jgi:hypothetical protein
MGYPTPAELWAMGAGTFNRWRRENDLKRLFEGFQRALPYFQEWLAANELTVEFILDTDNPGQFFYWPTDTYCFRTVKAVTEPYAIKMGEKEYVSYFFLPIEDKQHARQIQEAKGVENENEKTERFKFRPYFAWVKEQQYSSASDKTQSHGTNDTFRFTTGTAPDVPDACQWCISPGIQVLKLGGTTIDGWHTLHGRNLDFTNLDFLEICGKYSWNREIQIFYSTCRHLVTKEVVANFTKFYRCNFSNFRAFDSRFYWAEFHECEIYRAYFENSNISNFIINNCSANNFSFNRVEVENIEYTPLLRDYHSGIVRAYETIADNYKRFRMLYQANGLRQEASEAYFQERRYELKRDFSALELTKSFKSLWTVNVPYGLSALNYHFGKLLKCGADLISYLLWGFGERPLRILSSAGIILLLYAAVYFWSGISKVDGDIVNSLYFSIVTFTTLGFGDITPADNNLYKLIVGSEALIGAFCVGLLVAGFANKSRY